MKLIVGLGNPGKKYEKTRHNLGFAVMERLAKEMVGDQWSMADKFQSLIIKHQLSVILAKPQTMMNASGVAVGKITSFYKILPEDIWAVHDDVDLPLGKIKIRVGGAAAGHHGVESIIKELGTDKFVRFRLGIGHPGRGADALVERYVLREFDVNEKSQFKKMIKKGVGAIKVGLEKGLSVAMNRYN